MSQSTINYHDIPSPFYRVTLKAIVLNEEKKLLVVQHPGGLWEMPGGGWEFDENIEECLGREFQEEIGVGDIEVGDLLFTYRGLNERGFHALRIAIRVTLNSKTFTHGDDMIAAKFISRDELLKLPMGSDEEPIKDCVDKIWTRD
jgi:8-oxo-dGTP diphosphatase